MEHKSIIYAPGLLYRSRLNKSSRYVTIVFQYSDQIFPQSNILYYYFQGKRPLPHNIWGD